MDQKSTNGMDRLASELSTAVLEQKSEATTSKLSHGSEGRTKWERIKRGFYNPRKGTVLGRTRRQWGITGLFYLVFWSCLALMCSVCYMVLMATIDENRPTYTLGDSLIGNNPGLGFRPMAEDVTEEALISYVTTNDTQKKLWIDRLNKFLEIYKDKSKLKNGGKNQVICDYGKPPPEGKVCAVNTAEWGPCSASEGYGYNNSSPCVFIKLNRIFDWVPEYYEDFNSLPDDMPTDLKDHIKQTEKSKLKTVWVSCQGEDPHDKESINSVEYYPKMRGFPGYYYPYQFHPEYLSPVVAVRFQRPKTDQLISIECRAWAKNIFYATHRGEKTGSVHFELRVDTK